MLKKAWRKLLAAGCAVSLLMSVPGVSVLAEELQDEEIVVEHVEEPETTGEDTALIFEDEIAEDIIEEHISKTDEIEELDNVENSEQGTIDEVVGAGNIIVGDNVTATFDSSTGAIMLYSNNGTLDKNWIEMLGVNEEKINSIEVVSGTVYLPENSGRLFSSLENLTSLDLNGFDTSNVTNMIGMFSCCSSLKSLDLRGLDISNVEETSSMFCDCNSLVSLDLRGLDASKVISMYQMFYGCAKLIDLKLDGFITSELNDTANMFENCSSLKSLDLSGFRTQNTIRRMRYMFQGCSSLTDLNLSSIDASESGELSAMFRGCSSLKNLKLGCFGTTGIAQYMFADCSSLNTLDLSNLSLVGSGAASKSMFENCSSLKTLKTPREVKYSGIALPTIMYDSSGSAYSELPILSQSITLIKITDIANCTVTLSSSSFTYDGKEKKPAVTVKDGTNTLTLNTDYVVTYADNIKAGKATATVNGKTSYKGTKSVQFTINKADPVLKFASASVTKKPSDAVFTNTLTKITDGTVTFRSSKTSVATVNSTSGKVTIKGEGQTTITATAAAGSNYNAGTASYILTVTKKDQGFNWGKNNWGFINSDMTGDFSSLPYINQIDSNYKKVLASNLTNDEYQCVFNPWDGWLYDYWGGSCYGMSSLTLLSMKGLLPYAKYQTGATCLNNLKCPTANSKVSSLITYYQMIQVKEPIQQQYRSVPMKGNKENIKLIITLLNSNDTVLIGFQKSGWGGHAILAYGYEYGSYSWNGVTYQGCIKICDPNASSAYNKKNNIYFNSTSFNWTIPAYSNMTSSKGAVFNYVGANQSEINNGGYLSGTNSYKSDNFVARIDAAAISDDRSITKVRNVNGNYVKQNNAADDIVEADSFILGASGSKGTIGYNLYDANSSYKVSQDTAEELKLKMDYGDLALKAESAAGHYAIFDKKGYVEVSGESANYVVGMTLNENYPTKWFNVEALGSAANTVSMLKVDNGYLLNGDHFNNVHVRANNRDEWVSTTFTTNKNKALICESDKGELDVRVDSDNNGTYETSVIVKNKLFSDVQDPNHAFYKAIYWAADAGITKGYPDGTFGIDRSCTRGEMIMFLWRYAGKPAVKAMSKSPFKDVPKNHAFYNAIIWASQKGITKGYPDGTFGINRNVSRGECMMFLWRLKGKPAPKAVSVSPFKDVPKTHAFYNAILWGAQKKITNGYTSGAKMGTFGINENCTRGAIVTFLYRAR